MRRSPEYGAKEIITIGEGYWTSDEIIAMGFASVGSNVLLHKTCQIVDAGNITIGDNVRVDPFCVLSANSASIVIGSYIHIAMACGIFGGGHVKIGSFSNISSGVKIYSVSDDYSGEFMTNPMIPSAFTKVERAMVCIGEHAIIGSGAVVLPGVTLGEGCALGSLSLAGSSLPPWTINAGVPARLISPRSRNALSLAERFLGEQRP